MQEQWHTPIFSEVREAEAGGLQFKPTMGNLVTQWEIQSQNEKIKKSVGVSQYEGPGVNPQYTKL